MKASRILISIAFIFVLIVLPCCKGSGDDPGSDEPETQRVTKLITGTWSLKSVTVDGVSRDLYKGLIVTFTSTQFTATNGATIWPEQGTWAFNDQTATAFTRGDQTVVNIHAIDANNLTLSLNWTKTTVGPGRTQALAGKNVFVFGK